ncbi:MAG: hypothetical protein II765_06520, partial [Lachnospiraceae bacterium]|nr:hypothetical protein [Lachnospiraceae bacterium]
MLDRMLPANLIDYEAVVNVCLVTTLVIYGIFLMFARYTLEKCKESNLVYVEAFWAFFMIIVVSTFASKRNFGRLDIFMLLFSMLAVWILIQKRCKSLYVLIIPLVAMGVMVHQGYVFMYVNMVLVLLLYLYLRQGDRVYLILFIASLVAVSALF